MASLPPEVHDRLFDACRAGDVDAVKDIWAAHLGGGGGGREDLLQALDADQFLFTPLHAAASSGSAGLVAFLLEEGADVDAGDENGLTPFHMAADQGQLAIVQLLLDAGAAVDLGDSHGSTPILRACGKAHVATVKLLVGHGARLAGDEYPSDESDMATTPLHLAALQNRVDLVRYLLSEGAPATVRDKQWITPLHLAAGKDSCCADHPLFSFVYRVLLCCCPS